MEKIINYWGLADEYAVSKHKMEKGDHISKYERYEEVKEGYEAGFLKAVELFKTDKELMIKTFFISLKPFLHSFSHSSAAVLPN